MAISIHDVARLAGVSKTTAAYILSGKGHFQPQEETRNRVLEAARTLGYRRNTVAAALVSGRMNTFGVTLHHPVQDVEGGRLLIYYKDVLGYLAAAAAQSGLHIVPFLTGEGQEMTAERFVDDRLDGMIIACSVSSTIYDLLHQAKKPFVEFSTGSSPYVIEADNFGGAVQAVEYLLELGHRRIICFNTNLYSELGKKERPFWERTEGFRSVMERFPPWQEKENLVITEGDQLCYLLQHPPSERPTAIFATLEQDAFDAMDYIRECGLQIPKDISLIAFDNGPISVLARPKLTTIHTPYDAMAKESIRLLSKLVDEEEALPPPPLKTHLVVRASTSAPTPY